MGVKAQIPQWVDQKTDGCWGPKAPGDPEKPRLGSLTVLFPAHTTYRISSLRGARQSQAGATKGLVFLTGNCSRPPCP